MTRESLPDQSTEVTWNKGWRAPQMPQRQDSLEDQLMDVRYLAIRAGCYDAADWIDRRHDSDPQFRRRAR